MNLKKKGFVPGIRGKALRGLEEPMKNIWGKTLLTGLLAAAFCVQIVFAAYTGGIYSFAVKDKEIILYVQNPGDGCEMQCQIGTSEAERIESHPIAEEEIPIETIILLDNSLSVTEKYRPLIRTIMSELAANRMEREQFTIAVFSDEIQYLVQKCGDYAQVKQAIDQITYQDQETYLTDVLYAMLEEINKENSAALKRIIIISDGVDNKSIGYTKEELYAALEKTPYPIFTLGCTYKKNNEQLKNMFALSRTTGGESWMLDEVSDPMEVIQKIAELNQALKVTVTPKDKECDGTKKGVNLVITSGEQSISDSVEVMMPFHTIEETTTEEVKPVPETTLPVPTTEAEPELPEPEEKKNFLPLILIGVGMMLVGLLAAVVIVLAQRQKKKNQFVSAKPRREDDVPGADTDVVKRTTKMAGVEEAPRRSTMFVWGEEAVHTLILEDVNNPIRRFEVSLDSSVLVGYNDECQIRLNYEETVSGRHCRIYGENGKVYVENLSRSNGTYMDGKQVVGGAEIYTGCVLKLGNLMMRVEIR